MHYTVINMTLTRTHKTVINTHDINTSTRRTTTREEKRNPKVVMTTTRRVSEVFE